MSEHFRYSNLRSLKTIQNGNENRLMVKLLSWIICPGPPCNTRLSAAIYLGEVTGKSWRQRFSGIPMIFWASHPLLGPPGWMTPGLPAPTAGCNSSPPATMGTMPTLGPHRWMTFLVLLVTFPICCWHHPARPGRWWPVWRRLPIEVPISQVPSKPCEVEHRVSMGEQGQREGRNQSGTALVKRADKNKLCNEPIEGQEPMLKTKRLAVDASAKPRVTTQAWPPAK